MNHTTAQRCIEKKKSEGAKEEMWNEKCELIIHIAEEWIIFIALRKKNSKKRENTNKYCSNNSNIGEFWISLMLPATVIITIINVMLLKRSAILCARTKKVDSLPFNNITMRDCDDDDWGRLMCAHSMLSFAALRTEKTRNLMIIAFKTWTSDYSLHPRRRRLDCCPQRANRLHYGHAINLRAK